MQCYGACVNYAPFPAWALEPQVCYPFKTRVCLAKKNAMELWIDHTFGRVFKVSQLPPPKEGIIVDRVMIPEDLVMQILECAPTPYRSLCYWCEQYEEMKDDDPAEQQSV